MSGELGGAQPQRVTLDQLMAGRYFLIPAYQRHFAWRDKECTELLEDVVATARRPGRQRYMSTVTSVVPVGNSIFPALQDVGYSTLQPYLVVDGQQRLTSLTVLIAALCRHMLAHGEPESAVGGAYYRFVRARLSDGRSTLRLLPQEIPGHPGKMRSFFENIVALERAPNEGDYIIPAQRRLERALSIFEDGLRELKDVRPATLLECVTSRLIFILNTLGNAGDAGEVFEAINNRGIRMSTLENLSAYQKRHLQRRGLTNFGKTSSPLQRTAGASCRMG